MKWVNVFVAIAVFAVAALGYREASAAATFVSASGPASALQARVATARLTAAAQYFAAADAQLRQRARSRPRLPD